MNPNLFVFLLAGLLSLVFSCNGNKSTLSGEQIIKEYYRALNTHDFDRIKCYLSDDFASTEGEYVLTHNIQDYYILFQWDSVFSPHYELLELKKEKEKFIATVDKSCKRIDFLQDTLISFKVILSVDKDRIATLQTNDFIAFDFEKWQSRRDSLTGWIEINHPELSGFVNDMSLRGAVDYLKAIELYSQNKRMNK